MPFLTSPLHEAALNGNKKEFDRIKKYSKSYLTWLMLNDSNDNLPLDRAAVRGHYSILKELVEAHKKFNLVYTINNIQQYSPLLSAVRWFLKVLDGTYKLGQVIGTFNTGPNYIDDYLNSIKLLLKEYPEHINIPDNKDCNALYYVIHHWGRANNKHDLAIIESLAKLLIDSGISLYTQNEKSPMSLAVRYGLDTKLKYLSEIQASKDTTFKEETDSEAKTEVEPKIINETSPTPINQSSSPQKKTTTQVKVRQTNHSNFKDERDSEAKTEVEPKIINETSPTPINRSSSPQKKTTIQVKDEAKVNVLTHRRRGSFICPEFFEEQDSQVKGCHTSHSKLENRRDSKNTPQALNSDELIELFFNQNKIEQKISTVKAKKELDSFLKENNELFKTISLKKLNRFLKKLTQHCFEVEYPRLGSLCGQKAQIHFKNNLAINLAKETFTTEYYALN